MNDERRWCVRPRPSGNAGTARRRDMDMRLDVGRALQKYAITADRIRVIMVVG